jgi:hypothetical protein
MRRTVPVALAMLLLAASPSQAEPSSCESRYVAELESAKRAFAAQDTERGLEHLLRAEAILESCADDAVVPGPRHDGDEDETRLRLLARR